MKRLLLAVCAMLAICVPSAFTQTGAGGVDLPVPPDSNFIREVTLDRQQWQSFVDSHPNLERFTKDIQQARIITYKMEGDTKASDLLNLYNPELRRQGWKSLVSELNDPDQLMATYEGSSGGWTILKLEKKEFTIIRLEAGEPFNFEEAAMGGPQWTEDSENKTVTGTRSYRPAIIPVGGSGKLILSGFSVEPQVEQWDRKEVVLDYKKVFTGSDKDSALEIEKKCSISVDAEYNQVQVKQDLSSPATNENCKINLKATVPNGWKVDSSR